MFNDAVQLVKSKTDEQVSLLPVDKIYALPLIYNLNYLVPLALDAGHVGVPLFNYGSK